MAAALAHETATTSGEENVASPPKVSKVKEISAKGHNAAPKLVPKSVIPKRHQYCLMKEPWHQMILFHLLQTQNLFFGVRCPPH